MTRTEQRLRNQLEATRKRAAAAEADWQACETELVRTRKQLLQYGAHESECGFAVTKRGKRKVVEYCTCGYGQVWTEAQK